MSRSRRPLVFESFGVIAQVVCEDDSQYDEVAALLPPGWRPVRREPAVELRLDRDGTISIDDLVAVPPGGDPASTLRRFGATVRHHVAHKAPDHVFVHAGVVSFGDGAIVIPGSSRSGKSTLVAELVKRGATYYSDEYAVVGDDGLIQPYPKPLSLRLVGADDPGVPVPVASDRIGRRPISCSLIVVTSYEKDARWQPERATTAAGALALLRNTVAAQERPADALAAVGRLSRNAEVIAGPRAEARVAARELAGLTRSLVPG